MKLNCCQAINLTALSYGQFIKFLCLTFAKAKSIFTSLSKDVVDTRHLMFPTAPARFVDPGRCRRGAGVARARHRDGGLPF